MTWTSPNPVAPYGLEEAPCDGSWRVRLPKRYADFYLAFEPDLAKPARLYVATLNGRDALLWPNPLFQDWARRLLLDLENKETNRNLLKKAQFFGGESDIDRHGRFVLPKRVREGLGLSASVSEFHVYNDGIVRLSLPQQVVAERQMLALDDGSDSHAIDRYSIYLAQTVQPGGSS